MPLVERTPANLIPEEAPVKVISPHQPYNISLMRFWRPKKFSPRTQLPAMNGFFMRTFIQVS